ncbi:hypothetical protein CHUAL_007536 [Chamberlinius hualienensis]
MDKTKCTINSLPLEIFDCILFYLSDEDIIEAIQVNTKFEEAVESLICRGKKFNFSKCYNLKHDSLMHFFNFCQKVKKRLCLNFNYCYWLGPNVFEAAIKIENLQELHIIDCKLSSGIVGTILDSKLKALSISWSWNWLINVKSRHHRSLEKLLSYSKLFLSLEHLVVYMPDGPVGPGASTFDLLIDLRTYILEYCCELESLKVFKLNELNLRRGTSDPPFCYDELPDQPLLPKLKTLILDLPCENRLLEFVTRIMKHRTTRLNDVYFGKAAYSVFERFRNTAINICSLLSSEEIKTISFDHYSPQTFKLFDGFKKDESFIWHNTMKPKCSTVSLKYIKFNDNQLFEMVAKNCPNMTTLNLNRCVLTGANLFFGLSSIAQQCHQVTALILSVEGIAGFCVADILKLLGQFHSLKRLHLPALWITHTLEIRDGAVPTLEELTHDANAFENELKLWPLYQLTQNCADVEEFCLSLSSAGNHFYEVPETALASISKWKKLKYLQIVGITSSGEGHYLGLIFQECVQLSFLIASTNSRQNDQALVRGLSCAKSLKDLSVCGTLKITHDLCKSLEQCANLERLYADSISVKSIEMDCFEETVLKLPKLNVFWVGFQTCQNEIRDALDLALLSLQCVRPAFFYSFGKSSNYSSNNYPVVHNDLTRHSFLH